MPKIIKNKLWTPLAFIATGALILSGCANGEAGRANAEGAEGFEYGAPQEEVNALVSDLDPVTLTYQPGASSPSGPLAQIGFDFKEAVEERSNGQITIDLVWGQAIAGHPEMIDAVTDGRVDIADHLPGYEPSEFPTFDALATSLAGLPTSPVVGEAIHFAVAAELGERSEGLRSEFESQGVSPIAPLISTGAYYPLCSTENTSVADWDGNQTRVASTSHHAVAEGMGGNPVSLEWGETFEALERGTIDCAITLLHTAAEGGLTEVAPHIMYTSDENALPSRTGAAEIMGPNVDALPLVYQQIVYDAFWVEGLAGQLNATIDGKKAAVEQAKAAGGSIVPLEDDLDEAIGDANEALLSSVRESGLVSDDLLDSIPDLVEKWEARVADLGFEDEGTIEDLDEWWEPGAVDFTELTEAVYSEVGMENRPQ